MLQTQHIEWPTLADIFISILWHCLADWIMQVLKF